MNLVQLQLRQQITGPAIKPFQHLHQFALAVMAGAKVT
jgi:hypothetical protein